MKTLRYEIKIIQKRSLYNNANPKLVAYINKSFLDTV